ncbi:hypothetical protein [Microbacterium sp. A93]|uniref:hypothetical protein n=1 Tax=Microbacterium sp. A93 TaxID=3450716 RepID=UPI003F444482
MDLLRLAGAPGVGKSTTAWAIAQQIASDGVAAAYVDIDQLGMCYPAPDNDRDRWALKERALAGIAEVFQVAGVSRLIVSGVAWPDDPPPQIGGISIGSIWLDASEQVRRGRLEVRALSDGQLSQALVAGTAEAERLHPAWDRVDTNGSSEAETVQDVLARWQPASAQATAVNAARSVLSVDRSTDRVLWITGARVAGASRIGWEVVNREWGVGRRAGFIDFAQLSFAWNIDGAVGPANLERLHGAFREVGADRLVVVAPLEVDPVVVRAALPTAQVSFVRLTASAADRWAHARHRQRGGGPTLAGDDIVGASDAAIDRIIRISSTQASLPLRAHELNVDTRALSPEDVATVVRHAAGW